MSNLQNASTKCLFSSFSLKGNIKSWAGEGGKQSKKKKAQHTTQTKIFLSARLVSFVSDSPTSSQGMIYIILI